MKKEEWNYTELEVNEEQTLKQIKNLAQKINKYKTHKKIEIQDIKKILKNKEEIKKKFSKLFAYYSLKQTKNTQDSQALSKLTKYQNISSEISDQTRFFNIWFSKLTKKQAKKYLDSKELKEYKYFLENLQNNKKYILTEDKERIISLKNMTGADAIADLYEQITTKYEFEFNKKKITQSELTSYFSNKDPKKRETAYKALLKKYEEEGIILNEIYKNIALDWYNEGVKIRKYKNPISIRNNANDVTDKAVETLLRVCKKNSHIFTEYFKLKQKINKNYKNNRYHIYAPINLKQKKYPYSESKKIVLETLKEFDERMYLAAKQIIDKKHIDSHPSKLKRGGAFCYTPSAKITPYIMLNHTDTLKDVFTMIHELGHGIHSIASNKLNEYNSHATLPLAETASIFSENLLAQKILNKSKSKEEKLSILQEMIDSEFASIARQSFFVIYEIKAHEAILKGATKEELDQIYYELLEQQFKGITIPKIFKNEWLYIPHIYNTPFYCYAYAWGNLLVLSLWKQYEKEGDTFKDKYWNLLSLGGSDKPQNILKKMGINVEKEEFWQQGFDVIKERIKKFEQISKS